MATLVFVDKGASAEDCTPCTDEPILMMTRKNMVCKDFPQQMEKKCNKQANWVTAKVCQRSCFEAGNGYEGDNCCPEGMAGNDNNQSQRPLEVPRVPVREPVKVPVREPDPKICKNNERNIYSYTSL